MAYEAMNNAGARNERLIVILNDNDMSIAPPVGALSNYLARISLQRHLSAPARHRQAARQAAAEDSGSAARRAPRRYTRTYWTGGTLFEELGFYYVGPDRRPRSQRAAAGAEERARCPAGADPRARRHQEGQGLPAGRGLRRQVPRRQPLQRHHRRAGRRQAERAELHQGVRAKPDRAGAQGRQDRRHHRGHAGRHRARPVRQGVPATAPSTSASPSSTA